MPSLWQTIGLMNNDGYHLPTPFKNRYSEYEARHRDLSKSLAREEQIARKRLYITLAALIIWFFVGPFVGEPPLHFVAQSFGLLCVAYAVGLFRILKEFIPLGRRLDLVQSELLSLQEELGVNLLTNVGNPIEVSKALQEQQELEKYEKRFLRIANELSAVSETLRISLFGVFSELFNVLRSRVDSDADIKSGRQNTPGAN
jgi:hypothetical protein